MSSTIVPLSAESINPTLANKIFTAYADFSSIGFIGIPAAVFIWAFNKSISYYKDNEDYHGKLRETLDKEVFNKTIIPLYKSINQDLSSSILQEGLMPDIIEEVNPSDNPKEFIKIFEDKKILKLKKIDFSYFKEALDLQEIIENILKSNRNKGSLEEYIKKARVMLVMLLVGTGLQTITGIVFVYALKISVSDRLSNISLIVWIALLVLNLVSGAVYLYFSMKIDGFKKRVCQK
jgi:hypothetical protein